MCCPADTEPVIDTPAMVHMVRQRARQIERARVYPLGALTQDLAGERLTDMAALAEAGCVGVSNADRAVESTLVMRRAMQYASNFDLTVFLNALDPWLKGNGCVHEGEISTRLGLPVIPEAAETVALARELALHVAGAGEPNKQESIFRKRTTHRAAELPTCVSTHTDRSVKSPAPPQHSGQSVSQARRAQTRGAGVCASSSAQLPLAMAMLMRSRMSRFQRKAAQPLRPSSFSCFLRCSYSSSSLA